MVGQIAYALCAITSLVCFGLLLRAYLKNRASLLFWSSLCFFFFAVQNVVLFVDLVLAGPTVDLSLYRNLAGTLGACILLFAMIWEAR